MMKEPDYYLNKINKFFKIDNSYKTTRAVLTCSFVVIMLAFHLYIIDGQGCPDSLTEGLYYYHNGNWHLQCGRWALRYINFFTTSNVIIPLFGVLTLWLSVSISAILISKLWDINNVLASAAIAMVMSVTPATIDWSVYNSVFLAYGLCILLSTSFVYLMFNNKQRLLSISLGSILVSIIFGTYQAFIGYIVGLYTITIIVKLINNKKHLLPSLINSLISGVVGAVVYFIILKLSLIIFGLNGSERLNEFSIIGILSNLKTTSFDTYKSYFAYFFEDYSLKKKYINLITFIITAIILLKESCAQVRNKDLKRGILILLLFSLIPISSNIVRIITPFNQITSLMNYQNVLMYPLMITLCYLSGETFKNITKYLGIILTIYIVWAYIITANATFVIYNQTYKLVEHRTSAILNDVYKLENYNSDDTIIFAGFIDDSVIRESSLAKFARYQSNSNNVVYWKDYFGMTTGAYFYLFNEFGIDNGIPDTDVYNSFIESNDFKEMTIWPSNDSIKKVDNLIFVKLSNNPPYGY